MTPKNSLAAILLATTVLITGCATRPAPTTVASVDLQKYSGKWYEVARMPNWFQRQCASGTTAEYSPLPDGKIRVVNSCVRKDGTPSSITGTATPVPGSNNAKLKVSFFGPFVGDYWVLGLDEKNYQWALVGHPSRKYLWFLSRKPTMNPTQYEALVGLAVSQGYDPNDIVASKP